MNNLFQEAKNCCRSGGVHLIDVPIDCSENERVFIDELDRRNENASARDDGGSGS